VAGGGVDRLANAIVFGGINSITNANPGGGTLTLSGGISGSGMLTQQVANLVLGGGGTYNGGVVLPTSGALIFSNQPNQWLQVNGVISGAGSVTVAGAGTLTLSAANSYTGDTEVRSGTLLFGDGALGTSSGIVTVGVNGASAALIGSGTFTFGRNIEVSGTDGQGTRTIGASGGRVTYNGTISGTSGVTIGGKSTSYKVINAANIEVTAPPGFAGWQDVIVTLAVGRAVELADVQRDLVADALVALPRIDADVAGVHAAAEVGGGDAGDGS
jgi:autotransporter-associated beta strand protein